MGGMGSGNHWRSSRATCEGSKRIDLRYMRRQGLLRTGSQGTLCWTHNGKPDGRINYRCYPDSLEIEYCTRPYGGEWENVLERFQFDRIDQPFGGNRLYFRCLRCHGRCLVLYGGARFRCRKCQNLVYQCQSGDSADRAAIQMRKLCERLQKPWESDFDYLPPKPKGMHWQTYDRLAQRHEAYCRRYELRLAELAIHLQGLC